MKVFATLATVLGTSAAVSLNQLHSSNDMRMNQHLMKPSMGNSMQSQMSQVGNSDRHMDMKHQISNIRDMFNQDMMSRNKLGHNKSRNMIGQDMSRNMLGQGISRNIMGQEMGPNRMGHDMRSSMRDMHRQNHAIMPNQFFKEDNMGNYVFAYDDQLTERKQEGNQYGDVAGHYAYTMPNGLQRQVDFVADNNGFHVRDNADPARIKRSSDPALVQTKMMSVMKSPLMDGNRNMHRMSNMMQSERGLMGMDQQRYSNIMMGRNMMGQDNMGPNMMVKDNMERNMMGHVSMERKMMGRNIYNIMSNIGMTADMSEMMGQQMESNMMGQGMNVSGQNMMDHQSKSPNMMYSNMISQNMLGQDLMGMNKNQMSSNMMNSGNRLMGQRMVQQIESIPGTYTSTRMF